MQQYNGAAAVQTSRCFIAKGEQLLERHHSPAISAKVSVAAVVIVIVVIIIVIIVTSRPVAIAASAASSR